MTLTELRRHHAVLYSFIFNERKMRHLVFSPGHAKREDKLAECDKALVALEKLKEQAKRSADPDTQQEPLFEAPAAPLKAY